MTREITQIIHQTQNIFEHGFDKTRAAQRAIFFIIKTFFQHM